MLAAVDRGHAGGNFGQFELRECGAAGKAESLLKEFLGHLAAAAAAVGKHRLHVERFPDRTRFDVVLFQSDANVLV